MKDQKEGLRRKFKELRIKLPYETWLKKSQKISETLLKSKYYFNANKIAFYFAIKKEPHLGYALEVALQEKEVYFPLVHPQERMLTFHRIKGLDELVPGYMGIPEPLLTNPKIDLKDLDLILVPGLAFDRERYRLGYGGGYYDRVLKDTKALKIGIAFFFQIVKSLPREPHDIKVDLILTEMGFIL